MRKHLSFGNFYRLIDCLMLFGARIQPQKNGYYLVLQRQKAQQTALIWAIMVAESQDFSFNFLTFHLEITPRGLRGRTANTKFLECARERWYPDGCLRVPPDLAVDEKVLLFWLVGSWKLQNGPIFLPVTGTNIAGCRKLAAQITELVSWPAVVSQPGQIVIPARVRRDAGMWMRRMGVPEKVYRVQDPEKTKKSPLTHFSFKS